MLHLDARIPISDYKCNSMVYLALEDRRIDKNELVYGGNRTEATCFHSIRTPWNTQIFGRLCNRPARTVRVWGPWVYINIQISRYEDRFRYNQVSRWSINNGGTALQISNWHDCTEFFIPYPSTAISQTAVFQYSKGVFTGEPPLRLKIDG